eukprot:scaffold1626_cov372-Prasinococcus_capsulatus_cf.AAC.26
MTATAFLQKDGQRREACRERHPYASPGAPCKRWVGSASAPRAEASSSYPSRQPAPPGTSLPPPAGKLPSRTAPPRPQTRRGRGRGSSRQ